MPDPRRPDRRPPVRRDAGIRSLTTTLADPWTGRDGSIPVRVDAAPGGVFIHIEGYGECEAEEGEGTPVILELYDGRLRLLVFADINRADPTHAIDLSGAREDRRIPEDPEGDARLLQTPSPIGNRTPAASERTAALFDCIYPTTDGRSTRPATELQ